MKHISEFFLENILIDTHAHLNSDVFNDLNNQNSIERVLELSKNNNVNLILDVSVDINSSQRSINLSKKYPNIKSFIGIDPEVFEPNSEMFIGFNNIDTYINNSYTSLKNLIKENREYIFGIGESGMDFYHNSKPLDSKTITIDDFNKSKLAQEKLFRMHLELAVEHNLCLTIHSRKAENECLNIVKEYDVTGIFHSYTGNYDTAKKILDLGWGLGVNGIFTFKNATDIKEMYKKILGKLKDISFIELYKRGIFFETDSPYLSPQGKRGEINNPSNVLDIYNYFVSEIT